MSFGLNTNLGPKGNKKSFPGMNEKIFYLLSDFATYTKIMIYRSSNNIL